MKKRPVPTPTKRAPLYKRIREILESARSSVARSVNTTQVVANWLIGMEIVEEEQKGKKRAEYGDRLIRELAGFLKSEYGSGFGLSNLKSFKQFYLEYPELGDFQKGHALRGLSGGSPSVRVSTKGHSVRGLLVASENASQTSLGLPVDESLLRSDES